MIEHVQCRSKTAVYCRTSSSHEVDKLRKRTSIRLDVENHAVQAGDEIS